MIYDRSKSSATTALLSGTSKPVLYRGQKPASGLYNPAHEHDACGVGMICSIRNERSRKIVEDGLEILCNLEHRGAVGADPKAGDGAGILIQLPHEFFAAEAEGWDSPAGAEPLRRRAPVHAAGRRIPQPLPAAYEKATRRRAEILAGATCRSILGLGESVKPTEPAQRQVFIGRGTELPMTTVRAQAVRRPQGRLELSARAHPEAVPEYYPGVLFLAHDRLQGPDHGRRICPAITRICRTNG